MSLAQHVSAVEGIDRELPLVPHRDSETGSLLLGRRLSLTLSYDPLPPDTQIQVHEQLEHIGAYEVSNAKRFAQVATGVISCILASGITFGFAAYKSILIDENVYRKLCTADEVREDVHVCYLQDQRLNLIFIIASVTTNVSALIVGRVLDQYGPKVCGMISAMLLTPGSLCLAFADNISFCDAYLVGYFLLALGGTFTFVPSFHLSNAFPKSQGLILALITGAFDSSAAVFLLFRVAYDATNQKFGNRGFFLVYLAIPIFIFISQVLFMPTRSYETRAELETALEQVEDATMDVHDSDDDLESDLEVFRIRTERAIRRKDSINEIRSLLGTHAQQEQHEKKEDDKRVTSGVWGALHGLPATQQIRTPWFVLIMLLTVLQMTRFNFFISTIWTQYRYMLDSAEKATNVNEFFDIALPIGGVVTVPFIGLILDNSSTVVSLALVVVMSTVIGVLGAVPTIRAAYINVILFCIFRPFYYSAMSDYAVKVFGFGTFGTVYGTIVCLSGLFTFTQPAIQVLVHETFDDDPGTVNLWLAAVGLIIGVALLMYVDKAGRTAQLEQVREDMGERRSLLYHSRASSLRGSLYGDAVTGGQDGEARAVRPRLSRQHLSTVAERPEPESNEGSIG